ncbi:Uncharacterised protein [Enterobacter cloacae]|nr:Uncharacterised protein [Enterobacter cloacae]
MIGPGELSFTASAMQHSTGEMSSRIRDERTISSTRFSTRLIPDSGVSYSGTTGTPFTSSIREWRILKVNTSGMRITEQVVSASSRISFLMRDSSFICMAM